MEQPETVADQLADISRMLRFLADLPASPESDFDGEFGAGVWPDDEDSRGVVVRGWHVGVFGGLLEIFSIYACWDRDDPIAGMERELSWMLSPGSPNHNSDYNISLWIAEASDIRSLIPAGYHLLVETDGGRSAG